MASTMLGQGKNVWQAEIDVDAELGDCLRFGEQVLFTSTALSRPSTHALRGTASSAAR